MRDPCTDRNTAELHNGILERQVFYVWLLAQLVEPVTFVLHGRRFESVTAKYVNDNFMRVRTGSNLAFQASYEVSSTSTRSKNNTL